MVLVFELSQTPILWFHGMDDRVVLFSAGQVGPPFLEQAGMRCQFKVCPFISSSNLRFYKAFYLFFDVPGLSNPWT